MGLGVEEPECAEVNGDKSMRLLESRLGPPLTSSMMVSICGGTSGISGELVAGGGVTGLGGSVNGDIEPRSIPVSSAESEWLCGT